MLHTSVSPNIVNAGYQINVIPSEAQATLDIRALPDENLPAFFEQMRKVINDPQVEVISERRNTRPGAAPHASIRRHSARSKPPIARSTMCRRCRR